MNRQYNQNVRLKEFYLTIMCTYKTSDCITNRRRVGGLFCQ